MAESVEITAPLGKSNHIMLEFNYNCYTKWYHNIQKTYLYDKSDYTAMKVDLSEKWVHQISEADDLEHLWLLFKEKIKETMTKHIPT